MFVTGVHLSKLIINHRLNFLRIYFVLSILSSTFHGLPHLIFKIKMHKTYYFYNSNFTVGKTELYTG